MAPKAIGGATRIAAVFGDPVEHSRSPAMHNAAYAALGLDCAYVACRVRADDLRAALQSVVALDLLGANLTVPHKEAAAKQVKIQSREARLLGAVNCVVNRGGELFGDNTDARGLERDLRANRANLFEGKVIVIGAGGGAASAIVACIRLGAREISVCNRTIERARKLCARLARTAPRAKLSTYGLDSLTNRQLLSDARIVVNATSMGLTTRKFAPLDFGATPAACLFYDLVYAKGATLFVSGASRAKRRAVDGSGMLIAQGELAFELFNGVAPPSGVMKAALMKSLGRK